MPIEIRELIIKTEIKTVDVRPQQTLSAIDIKRLKMEVMEECKKLIASNSKKINYKR